MYLSYLTVASFLELYGGINSSLNHDHYLTPLRIGEFDGHGKILTPCLLYLRIDYISKSKDVRVVEAPISNLIISQPTSLPGYQPIDQPTNQVIH